MKFWRTILAFGIGAQAVFACANSEDLDNRSSGSGGKKAGSGGATYGGYTGSTLGGTTSTQGFGGSTGLGGVFGGATGGAAAGVSGGSSATASGGTGVTDDVLARASVILHHQSDVTDSTTNRIFMRMFIENKATDALPLAQVEVRYWMTSEVAAPQLHSYYMAANIAGETLSYIEAGADSYVKVTFTGNSILAGADLNLSEFQVQIDGGTFNQANDFSFNPADTTRKPNDKISVYLAGRLIWGCEPSGACPGTGTGGEGGAGAGGSGGAATTGGAAQGGGDAGGNDAGGSTSQGGAPGGEAGAAAGGTLAGGAPATN